MKTKGRKINPTTKPPPLPKLLAKHRGVRNRLDLPNLTIQWILARVDEPVRHRAVRLRVEHVGEALGGGPEDDGGGVMPCAASDLRRSD